MTATHVPYTWIADDLEAAAALLETEGWIRHHYRNEYGRCAVGALIKATGQEGRHCLDWDLTPIYVAAAAMGFETDRGTDDLVHWNDDQDSAEPVIELMKNTAKDLRNRALPIE